MKLDNLLCLLVVVITFAVSTAANSVVGELTVPFGDLGTAYIEFSSDEGYFEFSILDAAQSVSFYAEGSVDCIDVLEGNTAILTGEMLFSVVIIIL